MLKYLSILLLVLLTASCVSSSPGMYYNNSDEDIISLSLFSSDRELLSDSEVERILEGKIVFPDALNIVVLKIPTKRSDIKYYGYYYYSSEEYMDMQEDYNKVITDTFSSMDDIEITFLPSIMISDNMSIRNMREAAIRMQSDVLIAYRVQSDIFTNYRFFAKDEYKAYATCEAFLLDARTGIIPFSTVVTERYLTVRNEFDANRTETMKRAEQEAIMLTLQRLIEEIIIFFNSEQ